MSVFKFKGREMRKRSRRKARGKMSTETRNEIYELTDEELDDELTRPSSNGWENDVNREALRRILYKLRKQKGK